MIRWFREQYGVTVLDYYGLTESYPLCGNFPTVEVREGSMGRPMPGWEVAILDEDEQPLPHGERGEICLRARSNPHYPIGYWNRPEDTEEEFGGEWFHTKDAAELDEDGYVWYAGRADDVIISAGYRIGPFEVESACVEHPAVKEAAAVASPDPRRGDIVKAFIVLASGTRPATSSPTRSSSSCASATRPTPTRARSSSSTTCPRRSRARSAGSSCASGARAKEGRGEGLVPALPDYVLRNRASWDAEAPSYAEPGRLQVRLRTSRPGRSGACPRRTSASSRMTSPG